jgi:hypothetical protein
MIIPTIILDNFFRYPEKIVDFAKSLNYAESNDGRWPGKRSGLIHEIDPIFFNEFCRKVMKTLWPVEGDNFFYQCNLMFQSIPNVYPNDGWIHQDSDQITAIVYLSKHKECGTSIFEPRFHKTTFANTTEKKQIYINKDFKNEKKLLKENNEQYEETISVKSRFNRIIIFDSNQIHSAQKFLEKDISDDRLTLIGFFNNIHGNGIKFHASENNRI